ncbi:MAG: UDP-2,3-diacylglucosamine diphosphatase [Thermoanaerobaculia bacterium]
MAVAILADAHLGGPGGHAEPLVAQLEALPSQGCDHLILLGDLFQAWIGFPRFETAEIRAVVACLRRLRAQGLRVDYVEGNRDFFLSESPYRDAFDRVTLEVAFEEAGCRFLAVHGDGIDASDYAYRFWRRLSKSPPSRFFCRHLPARLARRLVDGTEDRLSRTNFKHKANLPEAAIRRYTERRLREGHDALLFGHFHEQRTWNVGPGRALLLSAWFKTRRVVWASELGGGLLAEANSEPSPPRDSTAAIGPVRGG